jgi:DNA integrity scanning protein DisA with diadenylate cyclase activity
LDSSSLKAIGNEFDEYIVAQHIQCHHQLAVLSVASVFDAFHTLAEQSYENKALTFGCVLDSRSNAQPRGATFPGSFLNSKRYKALSDGFRTAYQISKNGAVVDFLDLDSFGGGSQKGQHLFPDWTEAIAQASHSGKCGIVLSRQGEILVFYDGTLRFTYRHGHWQYWNHGYLVYLLSDIARAQHVPPKILSHVVRKLYRAALDVSFRRSGGLFVLLRNRKFIRAVVRVGDAIEDRGRNTTDLEFDRVVRGRKVQSLPGTILVEFASLDGAIVLDNSGLVRAYGAVLQPKRRGRLRATEGSRTKAAIGASNYGLAIKISSDGDITAYRSGKSVLRV